MMCRYVIVEDEFMVRKGIKIKMQRTGLELELAGEADNGAEGLELILEQRPELALVDMQMNGGDGVTLMRNLRETGVEIEIIIISAFTEFAYAQAGIQNDVCSYLVKPFSEAELREAVLVAMGKMQKRTDSEWEELESEKRVLLSYLMGVPVDLQPQFRRIRIDGEYGWFLVAEAWVGTGSLEVEKPEGWEEMVCLDMPGTPGRKLVVGYSGERIGREGQEAFETALHAADTVGISLVCRDMGKLYGARLQAQEARRDVPLGRKGSCRYTEGQKAGKMDKALVDRLRFALERCDREEFYRLAEEYDRELRGQGRSANWMIQAYRGFYKDAMPNQEGTEESLPTLQKFDYLVQECEEDEELPKVIWDFLWASLRGQKGEDGDPTDVLMQICSYLHRHFAEELSLDLVSDLFHLSPGYVSQMFTKRLGVSYVNYITGLRIEHACRLIQETELSNAAIAARCGFHDVKYYYKVFKKIKGKTIQEYKKGLRRAQAHKEEVG